MKTVKMNINGEIKEAKMFKTLKAAENYIKKYNVEMLYFRAHEYYVG